MTSNYIFIAIFAIGIILRVYTMFKAKTDISKIDVKQLYFRYNLLWLLIFTVCILNRLEKIWPI